MRRAILAALAVAALRAQTVEIYSEFHRLDPFGEVVPADRGAVTREILSPAVLPNGFVSFHVAVSVPPKESYLLYVATNPNDACRVALYKEHFTRMHEGWAPDRLTELQRLPDFGAMPDPDDGIEGQTTRLYLLDIWVPPDAGPGRFRVEVQLKMGDWTVRPMEVRVLRGSVPPLPAARSIERPWPLPLIESNSDAAAWQAWGGWFAGTPPPDAGHASRLADIIRRNALEDAALAGAADAGNWLARLLALFPAGPVFGSERYLKLRDAIYARFSER